MTKRCLKIKLCLTVISECDIKYLSPISLTETERDRREEGGALPARVEWELRQGGLADWQSTAHSPAAHHSTGRAGQLTLRVFVCPSVRPVLTSHHQHRRPGRNRFAAWMRRWGEMRWEEPGLLSASGAFTGCHWILHHHPQHPVSLSLCLCTQ